MFAVDACLSCSGNTYGTLESMMGMINVNVISSTLFYVYQRSLLIPVINQMYNETMRVARMIVAEKSKSDLLWFYKNE